jgi:hypothetical protein
MDGKISKMASNNQYITSIIEILDKLIENHGKHAVFLNEIKNSVAELRAESEVILENVREKLPDNLLKEQERFYNKMLTLVEKIENSSQEVFQFNETFGIQQQNLKEIMQNNSETLIDQNKALVEIKQNLAEVVREKEKTSKLLESINSFIEGLRSKRVWIALIITAITALATAFSSISNAWNSYNKIEMQSKP